AFLDTDDLESAVRVAVSLGGDADTQAAIAGAAAEAFANGVSSDVRNEVMSRLPADMIEVLREFEVRFSLH
ncbi:MAG: ADP-ribosylglycohydrolase family protein, partial [bacterium]